MIRHWISLVEAFTDVEFDPSHVPPEKLKELAAQGFDVKEVLYHGTSEEFEAFDPKYLRTAEHFYTTPDPRTASFYGSNVYACFGKQDPQADLLDETYESGGLLRKLAETYADEYEDAVESDESLAELKQQIIQNLLAQHQNDDYDEWDAERDAEESPEYKKALHQAAYRYVYELLTSGSSEIYGVNGHFQNNIMDECFAMGYKSVRFYDPNSQGTPISVVFDNASDIVIIGQIDEQHIKDDRWR